MKPSRDKTDLICTSQTAVGRCPEATRPQQVLLARALLVYVVGLLFVDISPFVPWTEKMKAALSVFWLLVIIVGETSAAMPCEGLLNA